MRSILIIILTIFPALASVAQDAVLAERYNVSYLDLKGGLPHNNVSAVFVDSNGFLWVARLWYDAAHDEAEQQFV